MRGLCGVFLCLLGGMAWGAPPAPRPIAKPNSAKKAPSKRTPTSKRPLPAKQPPISVRIVKEKPLPVVRNPRKKLPKKVILAIVNATWAKAKKHVVNLRGAPLRFTPAKLRELRKKALRARTLRGIQRVFRRFFRTLGVSHTEFSTSEDWLYPLLLSLLNPKGRAFRIWHAGVLMDKWGDKSQIRAVLDGGPAARAGLRRGDRILKADGRRFHVLRSFRKGKPVTLLIQRGKVRRKVRLTPVFETPYKALERAMVQSARVYRIAGKRVGYIRLWMMAHSPMYRVFEEVFRTKLKGVDGLILDLREGYGGFWGGYRDLFFRDHRQYARIFVTSKKGLRPFEMPSSKRNRSPFLGPMVVLINDGTRSAKEAFAYQFRRNRRAVLVGEKTAGSFLWARIFFYRKNPGYLLMLASFAFYVDGKQLEKRGVKPHITVRDPVRSARRIDSQLRRGLQVIRKLLRKR